tara:strand:+ start:941 stop:1462 length:522 start_codon:yes stop_codon:yes gene_type:complete
MKIEFFTNDIQTNISKLPIELQKRIYIFCWKKFWKNYTPVIAKPPSWYTHKLKIENEIYQSRLKNIHFLHLSFNTLPENKQWIMGCQCEYCLKEVKKNKKLTRREFKKQYENITYFNSIVPHSDIFNNLEFIDYSHLNDYDPLCGSIYEDLITYALRTKKAQLIFDIDELLIN